MGKAGKGDERCKHPCVLNFTDLPGLVTIPQDSVDQLHVFFFSDQTSWVSEMSQNIAEL